MEPTELTPEMIAEMMADAPEPEPITEADIDKMYAEWCARHGLDPETGVAGHKDHHHWAA